MRTGWCLPALGGWCFLGLIACATAETPAGAGGDGGSSSGGAGGGVSSASVSASSSASSTSSGDSLLCGNGILDPGEACDGEDLDGNDCTSFGLGEGTLLCNDFCSFYLASCEKVERCDDGVDNDLDGEPDCDDSDCAGASTCADSCTPAKVLGLPDKVLGTTRGRPSSHAASCSPTSGREAMYQLTALTQDRIVLRLQSSSKFTFSLSVRSTCGDDASEIACTSALLLGGFKPHVLTFDVVPGATYFVMVDTVDLAPGDFELQIAPWQPEAACNDLVDDDDDGYLDCDDAADCQDRPECAAGTLPTGEPCGTPHDCFANHDDPICLPLAAGFPGGYCAEFCDLAAPDCAGDGVCTQLGISTNGVCLDGCTSDSDCRAGYACEDNGSSKKVCRSAPETSCEDHLDNDGDGAVDCGDPSCQVLPACAPGPKAAGEPCSLNNECSSGSNDPLCVSDGFFGFPDGYCSEICTLGADDCPVGSVCVNWFQFTSGQGACMQACATVDDCRPTYQCFDLGAPQKICTH